MSNAGYPYDDSGTSPGNLVTREPHVISEVNSASKRTLVPVHAPFYQNNFILEHRDSNGVYSPMVLGEDYDLSLMFMGATQALGKRIYGGITVHRELTQGMFFITYQCLGGIWTGDRNLILEAIASRIYNPRIGTWDQVTNVIEVFPPKPHGQELSQFRGMEDLIAVFNQLNNKLGTPVAPSLLYQEETLRILAAYEGLALRVGQLESEVSRLSNYINSLK